MKKLMFIVCLFISAACFAQADKDGVSGAVMDYIDAFYYGDSMKLHRSISPAVYKWGYWRHKDSANYNGGEQMTWQQMNDYVGRVRARNNPSAADKFVKKVEVLDVQDKTAAAKCTAWWGTDYLLLAKQNGKWVITHVLWQSPQR
jgi:Putative lumazine-binding